MHLGLVEALRGGPVARAGLGVVKGVARPVARAERSACSGAAGPALFSTRASVVRREGHRHRVLVCIVAMNACNFAMPSASSVVISYIA